MLSEKRCNAWLKPIECEANSNLFTCILEHECLLQPSIKSPQNYGRLAALRRKLSTHTKTPSRGTVSNNYAHTHTHTTWQAKFALTRRGDFRSLAGLMPVCLNACVRQYIHNWSAPVVSLIFLSLSLPPSSVSLSLSIAYGNGFLWAVRDRGITTRHRRRPPTPPCHCGQIVLPCEYTLPSCITL